MKRHAKYAKSETVKSPKDKRIPIHVNRNNSYVLCYVKETMYLKPLAGHNENDFDTDNFNIINTPFGPGRVMKHSSEKHNYGFEPANNNSRKKGSNVIFQGAGKDSAIHNGKLIISPKKTPVMKPVYTLETQTIPEYRNRKEKPALRAIPARGEDHFNLRTGFFYPAGNDKELDQMINNLTGTIKKHNIKCKLDKTFAETYAPNAHLNYGDIVEMVGMSYNQGVDLVIWLGPPPSNNVIESKFARSVHKVFNRGRLPLQYISYETVPKQYKYLDMVLDFAFLRS